MFWDDGGTGSGDDGVCVFVLQLGSVGCFGAGVIAEVIGGALEEGMDVCGGFWLFYL